MSVALAQSAPVSAVEGSPVPRIFTRRPFGRSLGGPLVKWSRDVLGLEPLPWQEWVLRRGLVQREGRWASRTVGVVVARQNGKTSCATIRTLGGMALWGEDVIGAAQNRDIALEAWRDALEVALDAGLAVREVKRATGREEFSIGRARYKVVSSTRRGGRGLHADLVILDEVQGVPGLGGVGGSGEDPPGAALEPGVGHLQRGGRRVGGAQRPGGGGAGRQRGRVRPPMSPGSSGRRRPGWNGPTPRGGGRPTRRSAG